MEFRTEIYRTETLHTYTYTLRLLVPADVIDFFNFFLVTGPIHLLVGLGKDYSLISVIFLLFLLFLLFKF